MRKIQTILSINSTFLKLETQNLNVRSITKNFGGKLLEQGAFSDKQFCENYRACNYFAI